MNQIMQNLTQVIYQTPKVGEMYLGQVAAAEVALREAQLAKARELERKAKTVNALEEPDAPFALEVDKAAKKEPSSAKKTLKKRARREEGELLGDEGQVVDIRI